MGQSIKINLQWDANGRIQHSISGRTEDKNFVNEILSPSGSMFLCHQLGVLRPSFGLILCSKILQIVQSEKYILSPINNALKSATLELVPGGSSAYLTYHPKHSLFSNNDSLEEGSTQLVNNYNFYVYNKLGYLGKIVYKTYVFSVIDFYLEFFTEQISDGKISPNSDKWNISFTQYMTKVNQSIAKNFISIDDSDYDPKNPQSDVSEWINSKIDINQQLLIKVEKEHDRLCKVMGIS